ncbi:MAG: hypothetical protein ACXWR0_05075 [Bdellovibrio sp.]
MSGSKIIRDFEDSFAKELYSKYFERGIGSYSGRELEILIFHMFFLKNKSMQSLTDYELSIELKATETKIRQLKYEVFLRYGDEYKDHIKNQISKSLETFEISKGKVILEIQDLFTKKTLQSQLKEKGYLTDSSFNQDIFKVNIKAFFELLAEYLPEEASKKVRSGIKTETFKEGLKSFAKDVGKDLVKEVIKGSISGGKLSIVTFANKFLKLVAKKGEESITEAEENDSDETENESEGSED